MKKIFFAAVLLLPLLLFADSPHQFSFSETFANETGILPTATLFTASTGGDFIVTVYLENVTCAAVVQATVSWTDDIQTRQSGTSAPASGFCSNSSVISVHMLSGQSLLLNATDFGQAQTYTIYVTAR